jgi:hypothetical protein
LLKVQDLEMKLEEARAANEMARRKFGRVRRGFREIRENEAGRLEEELGDELVEYGRERPTSVPLEYSKFSSKVLDMRERERKAAWFRQYGKAEEIKKEVHRKERQELESLNGRFVRACALEKKEVVRKQERRRDAFQDHWDRKKERNERATAREIEETEKAVGHWERQLAEAQRALEAECGRIENNERIVSTPIAARPTARSWRY